MRGERNFQLQWISAENLTLSILAVFCFRILLAHALTWRRLHKKTPSPLSDADLPPISIIKPVRGLDQEAEENFLSFIRASYPAPLEVIFAVEEREDPVVPLIRRLMANIQSPSNVRLVFSKRQDQRELGKTINLIAGVKESRYDVLVFSDSDVRDTPGILAELVRPLSSPLVGMTYACPVYRGARNWVAALLALAVNETVLALAIAPPFAAIGSSMAIRKEVLHGVGGLVPLRHRIGIDAALGRAVCAKGFRIELTEQPVTIIHPQSSLSEWWEQIHRWLVTIRRYIGIGYLGFPLYSFPLIWASLYFFLSLLDGSLALGLSVMVFVFSLRFASFALVNHFFAKEPAAWRYLWLIPVLELFTLVLWLESYLNPNVVWRGKRYRVVSDATVRPVR